MIRRYEFRVIYLDRGSRYERSAEGYVLAGSLRTAAARAISEARKGKGFREQLGATFKIYLTTGPIQATK